MLARPLGFTVFVNMKLPLRGTFLAAPELSVQVLLPTVAMHRIIEISEQTGIRRNPEPTFAHHAKAAEHSDGVQV
jgi:hypothetical protein